MRAAVASIGLVVLACGGSTSTPTPQPPPVVALPDASPTTSGGAPCQPQRDVLIATEVYKQLESMIPIMGEETKSKRGTFGTCSVVDGKILTADNKLVGELGCGLRILVPGIRDDLGLELGATGADVLAKKKQPVPTLRCLPNGPDQARCMFD